MKLKIRKAVSVPTLSTGGLSLAVEGPSKAEISCKDNKDGTCTVSYLPTAPGDYNIIVKFDDKHIPGSPFTAKITGKKFSLCSGKSGFYPHSSVLNNTFYMIVHRKADAARMRMYIFQMILTKDLI